MLGKCTLFFECHEQSDFFSLPHFFIFALYSFPLKAIAKKKHFFFIAVASEQKKRNKRERERKKNKFLLPAKAILCFFSCFLALVSYKKHRRERHKHNIVGS